MADPFTKKLVYHLNELEEPEKLSNTIPLSTSSVSAPYVSHLSRAAHRNSKSPSASRQHSRSPLPQPLTAQQRNSLPFLRGDQYGGGTQSAFMAGSLSAARAALDAARTMAGAPSIVAQHPRREVELKQKIQALEDTVAEYERQKYNVMGTFAEYRERVTERERKLEAEYSSKIISLSDEVLAAKKDFEERMKQFQALQEKFEREKEGALQKLREEHQKEIQLMEQRCSESQLLNLEQKYMYEIQRLEEERKSLRTEKERLGDAFDSKLRRAQTLYETELHASKSLYSKELEALKQHEMALKEELLARQDEFRDRLEEIQEQFTYSKEELVRCKREVSEMEIRLAQKEREVAEISEELEKAREVSDEALAKLSSIEAELEGTRAVYKRQEEELKQKCQMLTLLETARDKLETVIADLQIEVRSLRNKVVFLENERANLESQSESQSDLQNSQVQALEAVMENLTKEKETTKDHFETMLEQERLAAEEREFGLKREYAAKINELHNQQHKLAEKLEGRALNEREQLRDKVVREYEGRLAEMSAENEQLEEEVGRLRSKLHALLNSSAPGSSGSTLRKELESREKELDAAKAQITSLIKKSGALTRELEESRKQTGEKEDCDFQVRHADEIAELRERLLSELGQCRSSEIPERDVPTESASSTENKDELEAEVAELKAELDKNRELLAKYSAEEEAAKEEDAEKQDRELALQNQVDELRQEIEAMKGSVSEEKAEEDSEDATQRITELTNNIEGLNSQIHEKDEKLVELQLALQKAEEERQTLEEKLRSRRPKSEGDGERSQSLSESADEEVCEGVEGGGEAERLREDLAEKETLLAQLKTEQEKAEEALSEELTSLRQREGELALQLARLNEDAPAEHKSRLEELERMLEEKEAVIKQLKEGRAELVSTSSSDSSQSFKEAVEKQSHHSDSKRSSISSTGGGGYAQPREHSVHLCKKAMNMAIVDKWHCLVNTLTDNTKTGGRTASSSAGNSRSGSKTPTTSKGREESEVERSGARSLSRVGSPAVSTDGSLSVPGECSRRDAKSPTRTLGGSGGKKGPIPIDKRPAWKF